MTAPGHESELRQLPWIALGVASIFGGILLGTIANGREGSKPFPFGPALAAGAVVAVFADPLHNMIISVECIRFGTFLLDMGHN
jgi:prepilin signal peptidase PulO-like enzyme (type II secretory pathway)